MGSDGDGGIQVGFHDGRWMNALGRVRERRGEEFEQGREREFRTVNDDGSVSVDTNPTTRIIRDTYRPEDAAPYPA